MERTVRFTIALSLATAIAVPGFALAADKAPSKSKAKVEAKAEAAPAAEAKAQPSQEEMMAAMMKAAAPGPEHAALNPLVGTWKTTTKMWNDPAAQPTTSEGTCERTWIMGGRYLVASYKGMFEQMPFEGMEVLGYDNMKKHYTSTWVDNMGTGIMLSQGGAMDPSTKTLTLSGPFTDPTGVESSMRSVTSIVDGNTYTMTMYAKVAGNEAKMMEITYTRVK